MMKKIGIIILCLLLTGCFGQEKKEEAKAVVASTKEMNTWCTYWGLNQEVKQEISTMATKVDTMCYFGAYYQEGKLFIPDNLLQYYQQDKTNSYKKYITVINDVVTSKTTTLKDETIVQEKMNNEQTMDRHIEELVRLVKNNNFDGLELDYENFNNNITLWQQYVTFINKLYSALQKENKGLRVLLEVKSPIDKVTLPKGPTYVIMCYNLYGGFSEPGPKADQQFLKTIKEKTKNIEDIEYALATGGFDWGGEKVTNVTVEQALQIAKEYQITPKEDTSGAKHFTYQKEGKEHTIFYSDMKTIEIWKEVLDEPTISLWKMGENDINSR